MLDHQQFLFGGEQIALPRPERWCGRGGRSFLLRIPGCGPVHCAHIWRRCSTPPGTLLTFSCFLHNHHPANMEASSVEDPWSAAEVPLICLRKGPGCLKIPFAPINESFVVISAFLRESQPSSRLLSSDHLAARPTLKQCRFPASHLYRASDSLLQQAPRRHKFLCSLITG